MTDSQGLRFVHMIGKLLLSHNLQYLTVLKLSYTTHLGNEKWPQTTYVEKEVRNGHNLTSTTHVKKS